MTPIQLTRWCVVCSTINYIESHFVDEAMAKERHARLITDGAYEADEIYVAEVTMTWRKPE